MVAGFGHQFDQHAAHVLRVDEDDRHAVRADAGFAVAEHRCALRHQFIARGAQPVAAAADMKLAPGDTVRTAGNGSVGLIFRDDSIVALGPDSEFTIEKFQFRPVEGQLSFFGRIVRGTINFISGQITNLAPENVELETPDATLAVRGTQILVEIR